MSTKKIIKWKEDAFNQGMPELNSDGPTTSFFEFWPSWLIYLPIVFQWIYLSIRFRGFTLPLIANPSIFLSGMVGESKKDILNLAGPTAKPWIAPFIALEQTNNEDTEQCFERALKELKDSNISFPIVGKPDIGCRGAGVKLLKNTQMLKDYICDFPQGETFLLQEKAPYDAEVGIFYIRHPDKTEGEIFSITLKYVPCVLGDGKKTLKQLIENDQRASELKSLYFAKHPKQLNTIIPKGHVFKLSFSGSHCRGSIFREGTQYATASLRKKLDKILTDVDGYYYGRLDIKFKDMDSLMAGEAFTILEMNGASSEATHIWDNRATLKTVYSALFYQYRQLFKIGYKQRELGYKTPSLLSLYKAWRAEKTLVKQYPLTD